MQLKGIVIARVRLVLIEVLKLLGIALVLQAGVAFIISLIAYEGKCSYGFTESLTVPCSSIQYFFYSWSSAAVFTGLPLFFASIIFAGKILNIIIGEIAGWLRVLASLTLGLLFMVAIVFFVVFGVERIGILSFGDPTVNRFESVSSPLEPLHDR